MSSCPGTQLTHLSLPKDLWLSQFLARLPATGRLAEGQNNFALAHFQNVAAKRFPGMETQAFRGRGFLDRVSGWPKRESQSRALLQAPSQTKTGLNKNLKSTQTASLNQRLDPTLEETFTDPSTGGSWVENSKHRRLRLAATLEALALARTLFV